MSSLGIIVLALLLTIWAGDHTCAAPVQCQTCASQTFVDWSNYFFLTPPKDVNTPCQFGDTIGGTPLTCSTDSFCVDIIYNPKTFQDAFIVRGCYESLFPNDTTLSAKAMKNITFSKDNSARYVTADSSFAMHVCIPDDKKPCNGEIKLLNNQTLYVPTPTSTQSSNKIKSCYQCDSDDEYCDRPKIRDCNTTAAYCYSKKGNVNGARYQRFGCSEFNPYFITGEQFTYERDGTAFFNIPVKTKLTHYFCNYDNCNKSASTLGFSVLLTIITAFFFSGQ